jgi:hypothetical protein
MHPGQRLADRLHQAVVIVRHDILDTVQASILETPQKRRPRRGTLAVRHLDRQNLTPPVPSDPDRYQHCLIPDLRSTRSNGQFARASVASRHGEAKSGVGLKLSCN